MTTADLPPGLVEVARDDPSHLKAYQELVKCAWRQPEMRSRLFKTQAIDCLDLDPDVNTWELEEEPGIENHGDNVKAGEFTWLRWLRSTSNEDIDISLRPLFTLLVRKEYKLAYQFLCHKYEKRPLWDENAGGGVLLLGWPGIGKSCFLTYVLVERLLVGGPTVLWADPDDRRSALVFAAGKCERIPLEMLRSHLGGLPLHQQRAVWVLSDSDKTVPHPPPELWSSPDRFVVHSSSPQLKNYDDLRKRKISIKYWFKPWSWREVYAVCCVLRGRDEQLIRETFTSLGPSIRFCLTAEDGYIETQLDAARNIAAALLAESPGKFSAVTRSLGGSVSAPGDPPSAFYVPVPVLADQQGGGRWQNTLLPSSPILTQILTDALLEAGDDMAMMYFERLFDVPAAGSFVGNAWEKRVLGRLEQGDGPWRVALKTLSTARSRSLEIPTPGAVVHFQEVTDEDFQHVWLSSPTALFVPKRRNYPSFDAILKIDEAIYLLQMTKATEHKILYTGLETLAQRVQEIEAAVEKKSNTCFNFVFVIPDRIAASWHKGQSITIQRSSDRDVTAEHEAKALAWRNEDKLCQFTWAVTSEEVFKWRRRSQPDDNEPPLKRKR